MKKSTSTPLLMNVKSFVFSPRLGSLWVAAQILAALVSGSARGESPVAIKPVSEFQVPFEARSVRRLELFRGSTPKHSEMTAAAAGVIVTVVAMAGEKVWEGRSEQVVKVMLDGRSTYYALLSRLEPLGAGAVVSADRAGALLFVQVPAARRSWCAQFARRMLLSPDSARTLVFSASVDADCSGYLALVSGTDRSARVLERVRRAPLQSVTLHDVPHSPAVLDLEEAFQEGNRINGVRRFFLGLGKSTFQELLVVETRRDELGETSKRSVVAEVEVKPSSQGLDIEVRRTQLQVVLATGVESDHVRETQRYRYAGGKLSPQELEPAVANPVSAGAK